MDLGPQMRSRGGGRLCRLGSLAATTASLQYVPAVVTLGQWTPARSLPFGLCRWRGPGGSGTVALTFDDGPDPVATPAVLDRLDELGMRATFFPLASLAERHGDVVLETLRRGHAVGTHGYEHRHHLAHGPLWVRRDLDAADRAMRELGAPPSWYRPAYGQATAATLLSARTKGWRTVLWSAWGREWRSDDPREVGRRLVKGARSGAIVLLHDNDAFGPPGMWRTGLAALDILAAELDRRGLQTRTLDDWFRVEGPQRPLP